MSPFYHILNFSTCAVLTETALHADLPPFVDVFSKMSVFSETESTSLLWDSVDT